jgi:hypothetical protein
LTISAYPGEAPVLSGGVLLPPLMWAPFNVNMTGPINGTTVVDSCIPGPGESNPGTCLWGGTTPTPQGCAALCEGNATCNAYTWHDANQGVYALACVLRVDGQWLPGPQSGHYSGQKFNVYVAPLAPAAGAGVAFPFDTLFYNGRRAVRARYPNANPETQQSPIGYDSASGWLPPKPYPTPTNVEIGQPSRSFDVYFPTFQLGLGGTVAQFNPPESFWGTTNPPAGNQYNVPGGVVSNDTNGRGWG